MLAFGSAYLAESPKANLVSISINDNAVYCQSKEELAVYAAEGGSKMAPVLRATNQIAAALESEYPDVVFSTLAYWFTKSVPNTTRPRHNVVIRVCADGCDGGIVISGQANACRANFLDWFAILKDRKCTGGMHIWNCEPQGSSADLTGSKPLTVLTFDCRRDKF